MTWIAPERLTVTVNGYGVIEALCVQSLTKCLNVLGGYMLAEVNKDGRELVFLAAGMPTRIARRLYRVNDDGDTYYLWNCQTK